MDCEIKLKRNTFRSNYAEDQGGSTIYLNEPFIYDRVDNNIYDDNNATYGDPDGAASFPQKLKIISVSNNDPLELNLNKTRDALTLGNFTVVSGVPLAFYINITDEIGVTMEDINQATASFEVSWQNETNWRNESSYQ